jgi:HD-like signal output (HDOD) protein
METQASNSLRSTLLYDHDGPLQCLIAREDLLDLQRLAQHTGRKLKVLTGETLVKAIQANKIRPVPQSQQCYLLPTIIDEHLLDDEPQWQDASGLDLTHIRDQLHLQNLQVRHHDITIAASDLHQVMPSPEHDEATITRSIQNLTGQRMKQRIDETLEIPPLSPTVNRIMQLRSDPNATSTELTRVVESDPILAAQVVSWASSPFYAAPGRVKSVHDAIVRVLGFDVVSNMAIGLVLGQSLKIPEEHSAGFTPYWTQAIYCSAVVEALARKLPSSLPSGESRPSPGMIYLAGLLHNFGYLVLAHSFPPQFSTICRHVEANPMISHVAIEQHLTGVCREQIGAWLMQTWNMPEEIVVALRQQQNPSYRGSHAVYANLVYIAMRLLRFHGIGDAPPEQVQNDVYQRLGLDPQACELLVEELVNSDELKMTASQAA